MPILPSEAKKGNRFVRTRKILFADARRRENIPALPRNLHVPAPFMGIIFHTTAPFTGIFLAATASARGFHAAAGRNTAFMINIFVKICHSHRK